MCSKVKSYVSFDNICQILLKTLIEPVHAKRYNLASHRFFGRFLTKVMDSL